MTLAIAWGSPYYEGWTPGRAPFDAGNHGVATNAAFIHERFYFGLTEPPGFATIGVEHRYAPASGGPEYAVDTYYLSAGEVFYGFSAFPNMDDGIHTLTASIDGAPLTTVLILATTPDGDPDNGMYGAAAWYEEAAEPPVSVFWTRFINSKEVIE